MRQRITAGYLCHHDGVIAGRMNKPMKHSSLAVRDPRVATLNTPHQVPIVAASSFVFDSLEEGVDIFDGKRRGTSTGASVTQRSMPRLRKLPIWRGTGLGMPCYGLFCSSGMAAISVVLLGLCDQDNAILTQADLYGGTSSLMDNLETKGVRRLTADLRDTEAVEDVLSGNASIRVVYLETPSNPTLRCADIGYLADLAHHYGALLVVDNTFATPFVQQPLLLGADVIVHSTTKFLNGHGSGVAGAIVCHDEGMMKERFVPGYRLYGGSGNAWMPGWCSTA